MTVTETILTGVSCLLGCAAAALLIALGQKFGGAWSIMLDFASLPFVVLAVVMWKMAFWFVAEDKIDRDGHRW